MLIIGRRGGGGNLPENSLESIKAGVSSGIDIVHIDTRLTKDKIPVLLHDSSLKRTHQNPATIGSLTLIELKKLLGKKAPPTLEVVLDRYFGKILLNIELHTRGSAKHVIKVIEKYAAGKPANWDNIIFSSFKVSELIAVKKHAPDANIALLQDNNPFTFVAYQRFLHFSAIGFHRLHINRLALEIARKSGIFTYAYTINRPRTMQRLAEQGLDGIITNSPRQIISAQKD